MGYMYFDLHEEMSKKLKSKSDIIIESEWGFYKTGRLNEIAMSVVDKLADEKLNYEEALRVLHSSEDLLKARAMVV